MSLEQTDEAARAVQKTPWRISLAYIESQIADETRLAVPDMEHMTVLAVTFRNGFMVIGKSAPADPENFDAELGMKFAREDAIRQSWPLFAFALLNEKGGVSIIKDLTKLASEPGS